MARLEDVSLRVPIYISVLYVVSVRIRISFISLSECSLLSIIVEELWLSKICKLKYELQC